MAFRYQPVWEKKISQPGVSLATATWSPDNPNTLKFSFWVPPLCAFHAFVFVPLKTAPAISVQQMQCPPTCFSCLGTSGISSSPFFLWDLPSQRSFLIPPFRSLLSPPPVSCWIYIKNVKMVQAGFLSPKYWVCTPAPGCQALGC